MMNSFFDDEPWFAPKRFGIGTGLPITWQGWIMTSLHVLLVVAVTLLLVRFDPGVYRGHRAVLLLVEVAIVGLPLPLYAAKTRGGWKWRWGEEA